MKSKNSIINKIGNVQYITYPNLSQFDFIKHASSTRYGGISKTDFLSSMNLGYHTADSKETVLENFKIFADAIIIDVNNMVSSSQFHNENIKVATNADRGKGITKPFDAQDFDALVTNEKNVALTVFGADCVPILFVDPIKKAIGAAHCGWRGTYKNLAHLTVEKMSTLYDCNPKNIFVAIAPCIHGCCYEVDKKLFDDFNDKFPFLSGTNAVRDDNKKYYLDLPQINKQILTRAGILKENILVSDLCTACNHTELFSHRKSNGKRGIMASVIEIEY